MNKKHSYLVMLAVIVLLVNSTIAYGQSGSRSGSGSAGRSSARGGSSSGGGSQRLGGVGRSGGSSSRISPSELAALELQQRILRQSQTEEARRLTIQFERDNFIQNLAELGRIENRSLNSKQNRIAFQSAKQDFRALRKNVVRPAELGFQDVAFRLDNKSLDRNTLRIRWPSALADEKSLIEPIKSSMVNNEIVDEESAQEFLDRLGQLNQKLNAAAARGEVSATNFARARRFISGLVNEVLSFGLLK